MSKKQNNLIAIYKEMSPERLQEEIDSFFEIGFALLESQECDSIEIYSNPNVKLKFSCEVIKDADGKYYN
jgi:hypothetical protein